MSGEDEGEGEGEGESWATGRRWRLHTPHKLWAVLPVARSRAILYDPCMRVYVHVHAYVGTIWTIRVVSMKCMHTYIRWRHLDIQSGIDMHACTHTCMHAYIHTSVPSGRSERCMRMHACMHACIHAAIWSLKATRSLTKPSLAGSTTLLVSLAPLGGATRRCRSRAQG